ncbi:MAG: DUF58 domain-containing protein [Bacteroidales bacterium]|nr:DUF58 domain-containing protein [Bacteroidales bacterium]
METSELLKKVRKIEIKTRGLSRNVFAGEYHSAFKGRGMTFSEVREYQYGDAIRSIDWNVTARFNKPFVKIFEEERELTVMLLVDVSASRDFGTHGQFKRDLMVELAAVLSFSAIQNNDKIGVLLFSDKVEKYIPPQKGKKHILRIIRELIEFEPESKGTDIAGALQYFNNMVKRRCTAFIISDFLTDANIKDALSIANKKHDLVALQIFDKREMEVPNIGLVKLKDAETGKDLWVDTSVKAIRQQVQNNMNKRQAALRDTFIKTGVDYAVIPTHQDYVIPLMNLFKKR